MKQPISYADIKDQYTSAYHIPYSKLLELKEWKEFRKKVLAKDNFLCTDCGKKPSQRYRGKYYRELTEEEQLASQQKVEADLLGDGSLIVNLMSARCLTDETTTPVILHVHHTYYVFGDLPWEYPVEDLQTLCHDCHFDLHTRTVIPFYLDESKNQKFQLTPCTRCYGTGFIKEYHYFKNGICFLCHGRRYMELLQKRR